MRRLLPWVILGPIVPGALLDLASAPSPALSVVGVVIACVLAVGAVRVTRFTGPTLPSAVGVAALGFALVGVGAAASQRWWLLSLAWALVMVSGVLAAQARSTRDLVVVAALGVVAVLAPSAFEDVSLALLLVMAMATAVATAVGVGLLVRSQRDRDAILRRVVVSEERTSMARDLHDLVAHEVTGIVVLAQASAGATSDPRAKAVLERIESSGQEALGQIRAMVQALRDETSVGPVGASLAPTGRGAGSLQQLVDAFAESSAATVTADIDDLDLEPAADAAVQRLVAEALTNVRRHSQGATRVRVRVMSDPDSGVVAEVVNDAVGSGGVGRGSGYGLVGVRERLAVVGGTLESGLDGSGQWVVTGRIPVRENARGRSRPDPSGTRGGAPS